MGDGVGVWQGGVPLANAPKASKKKKPKDTTMKSMKTQVNQLEQLTKRLVKPKKNS